MHKIAFQLGSLTVTWYGVLIAIGFLAGLWTASRRAAKDGFHAEKIMDAGPWLILGTIIGARTLYVITYWHESFANAPLWEIFMIQHGGLVFYGGLIGASLGVILYARLKKIPLWKFADALAPSIALGYVFGRLGCLMNGCCYGKPTDLPWAIHLSDVPELRNEARHPTQIYESLLSLGFYVLLAWLYRRKKFDGQIFATYLMGYAVLRSLVETFRADYTPAHIHGVFTPAQLVSMATLACGLGLYFVRRSMTPKPV